MPPLPAVANVFRIRPLFVISGKVDVGVRLFFRWSGTAPTPTSALALAHDIFTEAVTAGIASKLHPDATFTTVSLEDLTSDMGAAAIYTGTQVGDREGDPLPAEAAFVSGFSIARRYRGGQPKAYWPFGTASDITTPQKWVPSSVVQFKTFVDTFLAGIVGKSSGGCTIGAHCLVAYYKGFTAVENPLTHRYRNVPNIQTPPVTLTITDVVAREYVGSQRRRRLTT